MKKILILTLAMTAFIAGNAAAWEQNAATLNITIASDSTHYAAIGDSLALARDEWKEDISDSTDAARSEALAAISDSTAAAIADSLIAERLKYLGAISDSLKNAIGDSLALARDEWSEDISDSTAAAIADSLIAERLKYLGAISDSTAQAIADSLINERSKYLAAISDSIHTIKGLAVTDTLKTELTKLAQTVGADSSGYGDVVIRTAGEAVTKGALLHFDIDGKCYLADSDSSGTMPGLFLAMTNAGVGAAVVTMEAGRFRLDSWNWTPGAILYAGETPGVITASKPTNAGEQIQAVGYAETADVIRFRPSLTIIEVTP